jgi:hypothetical protein
MLKTRVIQIQRQTLSKYCYGIHVIVDGLIEAKLEQHSHEERMHNVSSKFHVLSSKFLRATTCPAAIVDNIFCSEPISLA